MAAILAAASSRKLKAAASESQDISLLADDPSIIPPEKDWECNVELGMLMLNG
jgi:hypothetical protein